ncbi:HAD hydrolase family protein [Dielma fastidiosa]|uniref:HAD hydrolase family protein n=1 Tax=Dielma fastidiosa TaxID=1034346 RepID=UPI0015FE35AA|nr:HAD hydrolase family protein [Dielma fastidiosa]
MIQLIFSDLEKALLNNTYEISAANIDAVEVARAKGKRFVIFTPRNAQRIQNACEKSHIKCDKILMNGAKAIDENGHLLQEIFMNAEDVAAAAQLLIDQQLMFFCDTDKGIYSPYDENQLSEEYSEFIMSQQLKKNKKTAKALIQNNHFFDHLHQFETLDELTNRRVYRFEVFAANPARIGAIEHTIKAMSGVAFHDLNKHEFTITDKTATFDQMILKFMNAVKVTAGETLIISGCKDSLSLFEAYPNCCAIQGSEQELISRASSVALNASKAIYTTISNDTKAERDRDNAREDAKMARREAEKARRRAQYNVDNGIATEADLELLKPKPKKAFSERRPSNDDDKKPFRRDGRKPFNHDDKKSYSRDDRKPFNRDDKKPYRKDGKPFNKDDKKPYRKDDRKPYNKDDKKSFNKEGYKKDFHKDSPKKSETAAFNKPVRRKPQGK